MKKTVLVFLLIATIFGSKAQSTSNNNPDTIPKFYLGIGTGINSYTGLLGLSGNLRIYKKLFVQAGVGMGSWGYKTTLGVRYDLSYGKGWSFGVGISNCFGGKNMKTNLELESGLTQDVTIDCLNANTLNLKATYNVKLGKSNTFYLDLGYAVPLQKSPWKVKDGSLISETSKMVLDMVSPGGLIIGLGFTFGM